MSDTDAYDVAMKTTLDLAYSHLKAYGLQEWTDDQLRMGLVWLNINALVENFLRIDNSPSPVTINFKMVALGLMGLSDFVLEALPPGMIESEIS